MTEGRSLRAVLSERRSRLVDEMKARRREKLTLDALEDLMVHLGGIREERKALVVVTEGWRCSDRTRISTAGDDAANRVRPGTSCYGRRVRRQPTRNGTGGTTAAWSAKPIAWRSRCSITSCGFARSPTTPIEATSRSIRSTRAASSRSMRRSVRTSRPRLT